MNVHPKITLDAVIGAVSRDDNTGFCMYCGSEAYGVEPDAQRYKCESCGILAVYGAEELLMRLVS